MRDLYIVICDRLGEVAVNATVVRTVLEERCTAATSACEYSSSQIDKPASLARIHSRYEMLIDDIAHTAATKTAVVADSIL